MTKSIISFESADTLPAHLLGGANLGNENVSAEDMAIPQLKLAQLMSGEMKKTDAKHLKGLEIGHIFNTLTGDFFDAMYVLNLKFEAGFTIFKKRTAGGGFEGFHQNLGDAHQHLADNNLNEEEHDLVDTGIHTVAYLDATGENINSVARIYMSGANKKVSDAWNTNIASYDCDRFGTVWELTSVEESNRMGQGYQVFKAANKGAAGAGLYKQARSTYFAMKGMTDPTIH
jgi:hypothetical protein